MIRIQNLTKRFGRHVVLDDISLNVKIGESVALWGTNGAGKTTIIRCLTGLLDFKGTATIDGYCVRRAGKHARQRVGYVQQESGLNGELRVDSAVDFFSRLRGVHDIDIDQTLARVGLADQHAKRVRELSGGMKQRLALAIALVGDPPVLLLDEVTASLDAVGRSELIGLLAGLTRDRSRAILFASHRIEEIASLASRVLILNAGRIARDLPVSQFVDEFAEASVLHLFMDRQAIVPAVNLLSQRGFNTRVNGRGILVEVRSGERMKPIQILHEARLSVHDFELLSTDEIRSES